jgi:hypothetical protein
MNYSGTTVGSGVGVASISGNYVAPQQIGHVPSELNEYEKLVATLRDELGVLEGRISGVLRPIPPETGNGSATPSPVRSAVAEGMASCNASLYGAIAHVRALAARADL